MEHLLNNMKRKITYSYYNSKVNLNEIFLFFRAYKLFQKAADLGHLGAKEELAFGHLMGIHLPMNFNIARTYFEEGALTGSPRSHYVK